MTKKQGLASSMPLEMVAAATKTAILCQSNDSNLDLKGDIGAVGRIKVDRTSDTPLQIDLNGVEYNGTIFGCQSLCVVSVGTKATEDGARIDIAKIETVFNEVVQLERTGDVFGKETVMGSTIDYDENDFDDGGFKGFHKDRDNEKGSESQKKGRGSGAARGRGRGRGRGSAHKKTS